MTTTIEVDRAGTWEAIDYDNFEIVVGVHETTIAPSARVQTQAREAIEANQPIRIDIDGTIRFEGTTESAGTVRPNGLVEISCEHDAASLFEDSVTFSLSGPPTDEAVLNEALANASEGGDFSVSYPGTAQTLNDSYEADNRSLKAVFRDMADRSNRVWWVDPAANVINVEPRGFRGTWNTLTASSDGIDIQSFDEGSVDTVRNAVTVISTRGEGVEATAEDATSIAEYGRRTGNSPYNIGYAATQAEAQAVANELLIPDPLAQARVVVPASVGGVDAPLANYTVDISDASKDVDGADLLVEEQTIRQGRATLRAGEGAGVDLASLNRKSKSRGDKTAAGAVINNARLADDSVDTDQLVNTAVIEAKLADAAVATAKLENNAVINGKLDDLSVSETKIQDGSIATPKLQAEAVTANEIEADTITAAQIAAGTITALEIDADTITAAEIAAGTITALEIAAGTITANEIDVLDLDAGELSVSDPDSDAAWEFRASSFGLLGGLTFVPTGNDPAFIGTGPNPVASIVATTVEPSGDDSGSVGSDSFAYDEMWAYDYFDAATGSSINDGGDPLRDLSKGTGPPEHAKARNDDGEVVGTSLSELAHSLMDICRAQQRRVEDLEDTVDDLETRLDALERGNA
jgi:hypothetical protein